MTDPRFDIVAYGATGFTGRQLARRLHQHRQRNGFRFALAARNADKLAALRRDLGSDVETMVVDANDEASLRSMVASARVVVSTAGPFSLYSDAVVDACVELGRDYVDITGETPWVRNLIVRHDATAAANGTRIVPLCGADSVPSDLGAWMVVDYVRRELGQGTREVRGFHTQRGGGLNGGTLASALVIGARDDAQTALDPMLLCPDAYRTDAARRANPDQRRPVFDRDLGRWTAPFVMAPINTRVVRRSAALAADFGDPYGEDFRYNETVPVRSLVKAQRMAISFALTKRLLRLGPARALIARLGPKSGEGPSDEAMDRATTRLRLIGVADDGSRVVGTMSFHGDAANRVTVLTLCESALALVLDREHLPARGGLLTPATAFGGVLVDRLRNAGVEIEVRPTDDASCA